jgi:ribosome-binding factor A
MKTYKRADRVKHLIQQELSRILQMDVKDPRVHFVTVTKVDLTADLREAKVLISIIGESADREAALSGLQRATGYIRGELGRRLKLKYTPTITFMFDDSWDKQERILDLLDSIRQDDDNVNDDDESGESEDTFS